jgi:acyl transferase domain-containing protein
MPCVHRGVKVVQVLFQDGETNWGLLPEGGDAQAQYLERAMARAGVDMSALIRR